MSYPYHTYRIRIANRIHVQVEARDERNELLGEPSGLLSFDEEKQARLSELQQAAVENRLNEQEVEELGKLLFDVLFDDRLRHDFFICYRNARDVKALFRIELDIDEGELPEFVALPWEFLRAPAEAGYGTTWLSTDPNLIFSRRRALWNAAEPIQLQGREPLRIVVAIASPDDLGTVQYEKLLAQLRQLSQTERIEVLDPVIPASRSSIDTILRQKPHIFHMLAHARFLDETQRERGQIALVNATGLAEWVDADDFSELFTRHAPGVVLLHACESGVASSANAFVGLASKVVQQNVPVVAAMQYKVSNMAATRFTLEFYRSLANNEPVDKAMQEGRRRIATGPHSYKTRDFATPLIFMRVRDGHIFQRRAGSLTEGELQELKDKAERHGTSQNFDEAVKCWKEIRDFGPDGNEAESKIMELQQQKLRHLQHTAHRMEKNQAYSDAISVWRKISLNASETQSAAREIERIEEMQQQHSSIRDIQQQLMSRMGEIKPVYFSVATRLKQIQKEGIDDESEILVNMVRQFLLQNLDAQDLIEMWQEATSSPSVKKEVIEYSALVGRLQRGEIIPVLGSEIHYHSGLLSLSARGVVQRLAQEAKYDDFNGPLSMISQYYEMTEYGRNTLLQSVKDAITPDLDMTNPMPLYEFFASLPQPIMLVSSCYDRLLEQHFRTRNKSFAVISHARIGDNLSKVLIVYSDREEVEELLTPEALSPKKLLEEGYSILYKVCGCFGLSPLEPGNPHDSIMISEEDYFAFAKQSENIIPGYLANLISKSSLLFLGNSLNDWQDRLILNALLEKNRSNRSRSFVVQQSPTGYEIAYWGHSSVHLYQVSLQEFADNLQQWMG